MKRAFATDAELIEAGSGLFEVQVDGKLVHSKRATGRFPDEAALIAKVRNGI